ncbi:gp16 family protein [Maritalea porphyrae]|uniref:gp16 family protein n=1 Tax=Maritalea porphyrae TaxID=880732 RepID=UPI0022AEDE3F|nr:regulatory protein GemA [Maritalea porphyrae]MCZ4273324.1 regulatory protein GemA [Maritalea porphyrae]
MNPALAKIHIAKKELRLDDDAYRDVLERITGKRSAKGLSEKNLKLVVTEFKRLGWKPKVGNFQKSNKPYVRMIHSLWRSCYNKGVIQNGSRQALRAFVKNRNGIADPDFLTFEQASPLIEALKEMEARA